MGDTTKDIWQTSTIMLESSRRKPANLGGIDGAGRSLFARIVMDREAYAIEDAPDGGRACHAAPDSRAPMS